MARFGIQQIQLNSVYYPGARGYQVDRGVEVESEGADGTVYETQHNVIAKKPMAELTTFGLKTMLDVMTASTDLPIVALNGSTGLVMVGAKSLATAPGFNASAVHVSRTALNGLVHCTGFRWSRGSKAEMTMRAMFTSTDGTTNAIAESTVAALPTQPVPTQAFSLTSLIINGSTIKAVNSVDVAIDPKFEFDYSTGLPEPTSLISAGVGGKLGITLRADIGDIDIGSGTGAVSLVFSNYASGGGFGANTVTLTLNSNWSNEENIGGDNGSPQVRNLLVRTRWDGTNKPLTWLTA